MISEEWTHWKPLLDLPSRFFIISVIATQKTLEIIIRADDAYDYPIKEPLRRIMHILFQSPVLFYKNVDEYCAITDTLDLREQYGDKFVAESALFQASHSNYLQWLKEESLGKINEQQLKHFMILEDSSRIDIITTEEPLVEWMKHVD